MTLLEEAVQIREEELQPMSNECFADYLRMLAHDYAETGRTSTAADYLEAARRIGELS